MHAEDHRCTDILPVKNRRGDFSVIILAGGQSRRMGSNKAFLPYAGKQLICYSIDLARTLTGNILISSNSQDFTTFGYPVVSDIFRIGAPIAGIHAGLTYSSTTWNLVLTCDMPHITADFITRLWSVVADDYRVIFPVHHGFYEPLCGFYHRELIPQIEENIRSGKFSLLDIPGLVPHRYLIMDEMPSNEVDHLFHNVNEKRDLRP